MPDQKILKPLRRTLLCIWGLLTLAGLYVELWKYVWGGERTAWVRFLGLSYEQNLPTWYASSLLLVCAVLLGIITFLKNQNRQSFVFHWGLLSLGFAYISLDETTSIHEHWHGATHVGGLLYFSWVVPAACIVLAVAIAYVPFLRALPPRPRWQFFIAGAIFVGGAVLMELPLGYWTDIAGTHNLGYGLIDLVEESMELLGVTWFLMALVEHLPTCAGRERSPVVTTAPAPTAIAS